MIPPPTSRDAEHHEEPATTLFRPGLPTTYRSRHDPHYVEQLAAAVESQPARLLPLARIDAPELPEDNTVLELASSIAELGLLQPLLVRPCDGRFRLIAGRRRLAAARRVGLTEVPCFVHSVSEARAIQLSLADNLRVGHIASPGVAESRHVEAPLERHTAAILGELQGAVTRLQSCLGLLGDSSDTSRERVTLQLLAAEAERASWLLVARRYLSSTLPTAHMRIPARAIVSDVKRVAGGVIRLRRGSLHVDTVPRGLVLHGDRPLLGAAISGLTCALFAIGESVRDARVAVRFVKVPAARTTVITVSQPSAVLSEAARPRFFDTDWTERPGGAASELAVLLARHAAALHHARLELVSRIGAGTTVALTLSD